MSIHLSLPLPPSGNHRNGMSTRGGKPHFFPKKETKAFRETVALIAKAEGVRPLSGHLAVELDIYPNREGRDMDNVEKTLWDALEGIAFGDDKRIRRKRVEMHDADPTPRVELTIEAIAGGMREAPARPPPLPKSRLSPSVWRPSSQRPGGKP